jgi:hypothetical protein
MCRIQVAHVVAGDLEKTRAQLIREIEAKKQALIERNAALATLVDKDKVIADKEKAIADIADQRRAEIEEKDQEIARLMTIIAKKS